MRDEASGVTALAGGARGLDEEQAPAAALAFALKAAGSGSTVQILTASPALLSLEDPRIAPRAGKRSAFATAWAEFGRDKARATGAFTAWVPKSNVAKANL